jgi:hypothetical protein
MKYTRCWIIFLTLGVCSCSGKISEQKHYILFTDPARDEIDAIASETAIALNLKTSVANFPTMGGGKTHNIELYGRGFSIFIQSAADQRCYSRDQIRKSTYKSGIYDVNIAKTGIFLGRPMVNEMAGVLSVKASRHGATLTSRDIHCDNRRK